MSGAKWPTRITSGSAGGRPSRSRRSSASGRGGKSHRRSRYRVRRRAAPRTARGATRWQVDITDLHSGWTSRSFATECAGDSREFDPHRTRLNAISRDALRCPSDQVNAMGGASAALAPRNAGTTAMTPSALAIRHQPDAATSRIVEQQQIAHDQGSVARPRPVHRGCRVGSFWIRQSSMRLHVRASKAFGARRGPRNWSHQRTRVSRHQIWWLQSALPSKCS